MNLFYTTDINSETAILPPDESAHCIRVLRMKRGEELFFVDGAGGHYKGEIADDNPSKCSVRILERQNDFGKRPFKMHIAMAPPKNIDRFEWFLEKVTEIGIDEITPVICNRSERREVKTERLTKVVVAAMKQSLKAYLPKLNSALPFEKFLSASGAHRFICIQDSTDSLAGIYQKSQDVLLLVGPEGDFTESEITKAVEAGFGKVNLGSSRLRTETAGVVACTIVSLRNSV